MDVCDRTYSKEFVKKYCLVVKNLLSLFYENGDIAKSTIWAG